MRFSLLSSPRGLVLTAISAADLFIPDHILAGEGIREAVSFVEHRLEQSRWVAGRDLALERAAQDDSSSYRFFNPSAARKAKGGPPQKPPFVLTALLHAVKGSALLGIMSTFYAYAAATFMSPLGRTLFRALRPAGGRRRGADRAASMSQLVVLFVSTLPAVASPLLAGADDEPSHYAAHRCRRHQEHPASLPRRQVAHEGGSVAGRGSRHRGQRVTSCQRDFLYMLSVAVADGERSAGPARGRPVLTRETDALLFLTRSKEWKGRVSRGRHGAIERHSLLRFRLWLRAGEDGRLYAGVRCAWWYREWTVPRGRGAYSSEMTAWERKRGQSRRQAAGGAAT